MDKETREVLADLRLITSDADPADRLAELLDFRAELDKLIGQVARDAADEHSWHTVGATAGTSRQAAWERWH